MLRPTILLLCLTFIILNICPKFTKCTEIPSAGIPSNRSSAALKNSTPDANNSGSGVLLHITRQQIIDDEEKEPSNVFGRIINMTNFDEPTEIFRKADSSKYSLPYYKDFVETKNLTEPGETVTPAGGSPQRNISSIKASTPRYATSSNVITERITSPQRQPQSQHYKVKFLCKALFPNSTNCTCLDLKTKLLTRFKCPNTTSGFKPSRKCTITSISRTRALLTVVIAALGAVGNGLVLLVRFPPYRQPSAQQRKNRRSVHQRLIAGLALSDLIFACLFMVTYAPEPFTCWWPYGNMFCKFSKSLLMTSFALDITLIFVIAAERYYGIVYSHRGSWSQAKCNAVVWPLVMVCMALSAPLFFVYGVSRTQQCDEDWSRVNAPNGSLIYSWISFLCFFLLPVATVTVLHVRSLMWLHRTVFGHLMENLDDVTRLRFVKDNRRILTIMITILVSFALLVGPSHVVWVYYDHYGSERVRFETRLVLRLFCEATYAFHVAANPVIYSLVDSSFRKELKALFCVFCSGGGCCWGRDRRRRRRERNQSGGNSYQLHMEDHSTRTVASCSL